jgi:hypothetical protein
MFGGENRWLFGGCSMVFRGGSVVRSGVYLRGSDCPISFELFVVSFDFITSMRWPEASNQAAGLS